MEENKFDYKDEIRETRVGCVGSSDAKMLRQIDVSGFVPKSAYGRMAVVKGIRENVEVPHTDAMAYGDEIEKSIYEYLSAQRSGVESNPLWVSKKYSRKNVKCISHPDIVIADEAKHTMYVYEVKASNKTTDEVYNTYKAQLYHHFVLARERASERGRQQNVKLFLVHYNTNGLDLSVYNEFDADRLTIKPISFRAPMFNLGHAMDVIDTFLETFEGYEMAEEVDANLLPENVKEQFSSIATFLREIKEREEKVELFKSRLYEFLMSKGISKVKCEDFAFTIVEPSTSVQVDYKRYFQEEVEAKQPRKARWMQEKYKKEVNRKGYVKIMVNDK